MATRCAIYVRCVPSMNGSDNQIIKDHVENLGMIHSHGNRDSTTGPSIVDTPGIAFHNHIVGISNHGWMYIAIHFTLCSLPLTLIPYEVE